MVTSEQKLERTWWSFFNLLLCKVLRAEGQTILLVEHKLDLVMTLSDFVLVMDNGKLIAQGKPEEVQNDERVIEAYLGKRRLLAKKQEETIGNKEIIERKR